MDDIYQRLKQDHEAVSQVLERLEGSSTRAAQDRFELFSSLRDELLTHLLAEQEAFYRDLLERGDAAGLESPTAYGRRR